MKSSFSGLVAGASAVGLLGSCAPGVDLFWRVGFAVAFVFALIAMTASPS